MSSLHRQYPPIDSVQPSASGDRRKTCRYPVVIRYGLLGWRVGETFVETKVRIENISLFGCLVTSDRALQRKPGEQIWFKVPEAASSDWVEGILIASRKPLFQQCSTRVKFLESFPYAVFKQLVNGPEEEEKELDRPEHELDMFWK